MSYGNYGRRGGRGGGNFQPKPRPILPEEHALHPTIEAYCSHEARREIRNFATRGSDLSRDTITIEGDPERKTLSIPIAAMYSEMQFGVPPHHNAFPALRKIDTRYEANLYAAIYDAPIMWEHNTAETDFRHIPGFTRYCIDTHGRIVNAYNGRKVEPMNQYLIELVPDGRQNEVKKVNIDMLKALAFLPLPKGFTDFGFRTYSHDIGVDMTNGQYGWLDKGKIKVKNNETGMQGEYETMAEFIKREVNDFALMKDLNQVMWKGMDGKVVNVGPFTMKESNPPKEAPGIPSVSAQSSGNGQPQQQEQQQSSAPQQQEQNSLESDTSFEDDDFNF